MSKTLLGRIKEAIWGAPEPPKAPVPLHQRILNPLGAGIGSILTLDVLDYREAYWEVLMIEAYDVEVDHKNWRWTDYVCAADGTQIFLRVIPSNPPKALVGGLAYEYGYHSTEGKEISRAAKEQEFYIDDENGRQTYYRVDDVTESYRAKVKILEGNSLQNDRREFWDFWREVEVEGVKEIQYLYVERNWDSGWLEVSMFKEIDLGRVTLV